MGGRSVHSVKESKPAGEKKKEAKIVCALEMFLAGFSFCIISLLHLIFVSGKLIGNICLVSAILDLSIRHTEYTWKKGVGELVASEARAFCTSSATNRVELFVAFKPPDRPQWDKDSRIVKDYAGLLLHCIS